MQPPYINYLTLFFCAVIAEEGKHAKDKQNQYQKENEAAVKVTAASSGHRISSFLCIYFSFFVFPVPKYS